MQIIIDIPKHYIGMLGYSNENIEVILDAVRNGTPLPKGHGRLIDADAIDTRFSDPEVVETLEEAPTIIPADKEGKE